MAMVVCLPAAVVGWLLPPKAAPAMHVLAWGALIWVSMLMIQREWHRFL